MGLKKQVSSEMKDPSSILSPPSASKQEETEQWDNGHATDRADLPSKNAHCGYASHFDPERDQEADTLADSQPRVPPTIKAFSAQCCLCLKWRLIPTKELYEEIRQTVTENPFVCTRASAWLPHASCNDPSDISQAESLVWAIDRPDIPMAPAGWERLLSFRGGASGKFADVYYRSPSGRRLRSMREVERYLEEHPEYEKAGVTKSHFSFLKPKPLHPKYIHKRSSEALHEMRGSITHKKSCIKK